MQNDKIGLCLHCAKSDPCDLEIEITSMETVKTGRALKYKGNNYNIII
jgi:hypothetical protein